MLYSLQKLKKEILREIGAPAAEFSTPPSREMGDLSFPCFEAAKNKGVNPAEFATSQLKSFQSQKWQKIFSDVRAAGPYLNFFLKPEYLAGKVLKDIRSFGRFYGQNLKPESLKVMVEFSNGNTHKEYHVGHLRNISFGAAITRLLNLNGNVAIPVSYINDFGIHVAKTLWNWRNDASYASRPEPKGYLLGQCYSAASKKLENDPEAKLEVGRLMKAIESRQGAEYELFLETRQWSIDYFAAIYRELDVKFGKIFYESEVIARGLDIVAELLDKGILKKSEGAVIADLESYGLGVLPIIRSDGTALYPVGDLALASEKFQAYNLDESIYVVDVRQSLYFKQLFKILELMGYKQTLKHLAYDFVTLPDGMMSSRSGNVITYEDLKTAIVDKLKLETRKRHEDWSDERVAAAAFGLAQAIIRFEMLKVGAEKIITFNLADALQFEGYTACYLEYTYARAQSIMRKRGFVLPSLLARDRFLLKEDKEKNLLLKLAAYPDVVAAAGKDFDPSLVAKYLFELAKSFNDYYHSVVILKAQPATKRARLKLVRAAAITLKNGFYALGLPDLDEM